jgi:hypothetical protein
MEVAASAHGTTDVLIKDTIVELGRKAPWASVNRHGRGHAVLIGAGVSYDYLLEDSPDNARWLSNLMTLLVDRSRESAGWAVRPFDFAAAGRVLLHITSQAVRESKT